MFGRATTLGIGPHSSFSSVLARGDTITCTETDLLFQADVLLCEADHAAAGHATGQSVVGVHVVLELAGSADQQSTSAAELDEFAPDQRRRHRPPQIPLRSVAQFHDETLDIHEAWYSGLEILSRESRAYNMHFSPRLEQESTAINRGTHYFNGFVKIKHVALVVAGQSRPVGPLASYAPAKK